MPLRKTHSYYVVMIDYGQKGLEATATPEQTRRDVVARIKSHEYQNIVFIHHIDGLFVEDVTSELIDAAELELKEEARERRATPLADRFDHARDLRKHQVA